MVNCPVIDADGHVLEKEKYIRKYLEAPWDKRSTALRTRDQPWDANLFDSFEMAVRWEDLSPKEQIDEWHAVMEREGMVHAICFPTGSGNVSKIQELDFALAVARACNTHFAKEFNALSNRVSCVGVLPLRDPKAAAEELRRAVTELGLKGFEILPMGLPMALGSAFYDPVYAEAERLGAVIGIHGSRSNSHEIGAANLSTFAEVHSYAFTVGLLLQFTHVVCQGLPVRFPNLKLAFLEIGATWLPYYLDRLDEHWEKRAKHEMPLLKDKPSDLVRKSKMYFSLESGESLLPESINYLGAEHFLYASDIPHWDNEFPGNLHALRKHPRISDGDKEKILYSNAKQLFAL